MIGALKVAQKEGRKRIRNDRIIAVPEDDHRGEALSDARKLPEPLRSELEKFFEAGNALKNKSLEFLGWAGPDEGTRLIREAERKFAG